MTKEWGDQERGVHDLDEIDDSWLQPSVVLKRLRRLAIAVIGGTVVLIGLAMVVLPGPAIVVIPAGLAILATEFLWAKRLLHRVREKLPAKVQEKLPGKRSPADENER